MKKILFIFALLCFATITNAQWAVQPSGTANNLVGVSFTDANNGTAVGGGGTILRTTDGGATWGAQPSGTTNALWGVSFTDANNGTAVGSSGTILRTTDGGTTWAHNQAEQQMICLVSPLPMQITEQQWALAAQS